MDNILEYKGYHTKITYDNDDNCFRGIIEGINDFVNFEGNLENIEIEVHKAVDDYLEFRKEINKS